MMPAELEQMNKWTELLQGTLHLIQEITKWEVLVPTSLVSAVVLLIYQIPLVRIILNNMYTTIRTMAACGVIAGIAGVSYRILASLFRTVAYYFSARKERLKHTEREEAEKKLFAKKFNCLTDIELSVLKYMTHKGGISWLPISDGAALNLYETGFFCLVFNVTMLRGELLGEHKQCLAYKVSEECEKNIQRLSGDILTRWNSVSPAEWLDVYENALEA